MSSGLEGMLKQDKRKSMVTTKCHSVNTNDLFSLEQAGVLRRICMAFRRRKHTHTHVNGNYMVRY
jgi:hypothetical protein